MLYSCPCGNTLNIATKFFWFLTEAELSQRCMDNTTINEMADPWAGSYMETGDRDLPDEDEEEDDDDPTPDIDLTMVGFEE